MTLLEKCFQSGKIGEELNLSRELPVQFQHFCWFVLLCALATRKTRCYRPNTSASVNEATAVHTPLIPLDDQVYSIMYSFDSG